MWSVFIIIIPIIVIYLFVDAFTTLNSLDEKCNNKKLSSKLTISQKKELLRIDSYWIFFDIGLLLLFFLFLLVKYQFIFNLKILSSITPFMLTITWFIVFIAGNLIFYKRTRQI